MLHSTWWSESFEMDEQAALWFSSLVLKLFAFRFLEAIPFVEKKKEEKEKREKKQWLSMMQWPSLYSTAQMSSQMGIFISIGRQ